MWYNEIVEKPVLQRLLSSLQRDRLSNFVKEAHELGDACFYYALISCHNYLYPEELIPKDIEERLRAEGNKGNGTKVIDLIGEVKRLEPDLKLKIDHVVNHSNLPMEQIKGDLSLPDEIPVINSEDNFLAPEPGHSTAITFLKSNVGEGGHYMALVENPRFQEGGYGSGGDTEFQTIKDQYKAGFSFILVKSK